LDPGRRYQRADARPLDPALTRHRTIFIAHQLVLLVARPPARPSGSRARPRARLSGCLCRVVVGSSGDEPTAAPRTAGLTCGHRSPSAGGTCSGTRCSWRTGACPRWRRPVPRYGEVLLGSRVLRLGRPRMVPPFERADGHPISRAMPVMITAMARSGTEIRSSPARISVCRVMIALLSCKRGGLIRRAVSDRLDAAGRRAQTGLLRGVYRHITDRVRPD
jgi:hypothetical protein